MKKKRDLKEAHYTPSEDVATWADINFLKIYDEKISMDEAITMMRNLRMSKDKFDREIF